MSRAMRNRCIELCMTPDSAVQSSETRSTALNELTACLASEGVPGTQLPEAMAAAHQQLASYLADSHQ